MYTPEVPISQASSTKNQGIRRELERFGHDCRPIRWPEWIWETRDFTLRLLKAVISVRNRAGSMKVVPDRPPLLSWKKTWRMISCFLPCPCSIFWEERQEKMLNSHCLCGLSRGRPTSWWRTWTWTLSSRRETHTCWPPKPLFATVIMCRLSHLNKYGNFGSKKMEN